MRPGKFSINVTFTADDGDVAHALAEIIESLAPWMVDNVRVGITSTYFDEEMEA